MHENTVETILSRFITSRSSTPWRSNTCHNSIVHFAKHTPKYITEHRISHHITLLSHSSSLKQTLRLQPPTPPSQINRCLFLWKLEINLWCRVVMSIQALLRVPGKAHDRRAAFLSKVWSKPRLYPFFTVTNSHHNRQRVEWHHIYDNWSQEPPSSLPYTQLLRPACLREWARVMAASSGRTAVTHVRAFERSTFSI